MPPTPAPDAAPADTRPPGTALEVLLAFLRLGLTSFGGPVAHLGCFRTEFVERRRWLDDARYADLVALCQFLPGPASSQVGMALGLQRAGWSGALAAWAGFTLPSAIVMILFALGVAHWSWLAGSGLVHGLKVVAVAIVAQAVWGMARSLCPDVPRAALAALAAVLALGAPGLGGQLAAIAVGAAIGRWALRPAGTGAPPAAAPGTGEGFAVGRRTGAWLLGACAVLLIGLPALAAALDSPALRAASVFYQAGALVFGGGHVVLPLLQAGVVPPGWVDAGTFLAGYGAAQAVPGPLFTFAAFLGAAMPAPMGGWSGGIAMLVAVFVPAFLLVAGALPFWEALRRRETARRTLAGLNAAVVGLLAAALYDPVFTSAIASWADAAIALAALALLLRARWSPVAVVALAAIAGALAAAIG